MLRDWEVSRQTAKARLEDRAGLGVSTQDARSFLEPPQGCIKQVARLVRKSSHREIDSDPRPSHETEGDAAMKREKLDVVRGSGNVFRDLGHKSADAEQFKASWRRKSFKVLDRERLTVRAAHARLHCRSQLLARPERQPQPLHRGSPHVDP